MNRLSLEQRVFRLERELDRLRRELKGRGWVEGGAVPSETAGETAAAGVEPGEATISAETPVSSAAAVSERGHESPYQSGRQPEARAEDDVAARLRRLAVGSLPRTPFPTVSRSPADTTLERRIGGQVFAVAGALIVVIGLALAVKVAIDQGWFKLFPPGLRCLAIAAVGAGLLALGEVLRTRVRAIAVAGLNAAGIGALFVAAYASYGVFHLISAPVAFAAMSGAAGVGLAVALRHGFLSSAVLSLVGAYMVPVLLAEAETNPYVMPVYLLLLSAVALTLAAARARPFGPVRDVAWIGAGLLGFFWTLAEAESVPGAVLAFWACAWAMHQAELLVTASRGHLWGKVEAGGTKDERDAPPSVSGEAGAPEHRQAGRQSHRKKWRRRVEPILLAVSTTAGAVAIGAVVLEHRTQWEHWLAPAAAFAATSAIAITFGGHLRVLRDKPRTDLETLAAAHAAQAGALLITTIALALGGWVEVSAWLAMGVGAVVAGRWTGARSLEGYGLAMLAIASTRLAVYDVAAGPASVPWSVAAGVAIAPWTVLVLGAGAAWMVAGSLMLVAVRDEDDRAPVRPRPGPATACAALGAAMWMLAPAHFDSSAAPVCVVWLGLSLALLAESRLERRLHLEVLGAIVAAVAIFPWMIAADFAAWLHDARAPGTHPALWLAAAVTVCLLVHAWAARRRFSWDEYGSPWPLLAALGGAVAFAATSIEVARCAALLADDDTARRAAVSIWWGLWGVSLVVGGFWRRAPGVRYVGLALMAIAAAKAVLLDLAGVPPLWRVASFVGLGALMLGVAVLYGRVSAGMEGGGMKDEG